MAAILTFIVLLFSVGNPDVNNCENSEQIRNSINAYLLKGDPAVFSEQFKGYLDINNRPVDSCYFPNSEADVGLYQRFLYVMQGESQHDLKAMKLLTDIYLTNRNNSEYSEYFTFELLPMVIENAFPLYLESVNQCTGADRTRCLLLFEYMDEALLRKLIADARADDGFDKYSGIIEDIETKLERRQ